jgi:hypothetical protein
MSKAARATKSSISRFRPLQDFGSISRDNQRALGARWCELQIVRFITGLL